MCSPTLDSYFIKCYYFVELTLCAVFSAAATAVAVLFSLFYLNFSWSYFKMNFLKFSEKVLKLIEPFGSVSFPFEIFRTYKTGNAYIDIQFVEHMCKFLIQL